MWHLDIAWFLQFRKILQDELIIECVLLYYLIADLYGDASSKGEQKYFDNTLLIIFHFFPFLFVPVVLNIAVFSFLVSVQ